MKLSFTLSAIALTAMLFSCSEKKTEAPVKQQFCLSDTFKQMITIDTVKTCNVEDELQLTGEVSFNENQVVKIFPNSSGQVLEVKVSMGDKVQKGQVLAVMKSADVAGNYSDLNNADADLAIAKSQLDNEESLYKNGIASQREYEEAKQDYQKALAAKEKINAAININGGGQTKAGGLYNIVAPTDGYIVEKNVNAGSFIRQDMGNNLFTISDLKEVWVYANVFEADIPKVKQGYHASITTLAYPDKVFNGTVDQISEVLDPNNKTLRVRIKLPNDGLQLKPEMFTTVKIDNTEGVSAICIPKSAQVESYGKTYVVVYNSDCDLKVAQIDVLKVVGDRLYIKDGLTVGQKIITRQALQLFQEFTD
ncbi:efflux RND transporter periplasmic adaptor subunit [Ferruginibacter albus]|uniref:efflux RND transporter periplasmic adaptor subunit n=1 Tax=Ferruginibacter albus TaxID=2875540 RepID=UPI001CC56B70|nr:efflux RND transporter periplasmic adaptor subunit [Ferruginibacter albus]UAY52324.1 efflux RND transporter periplasmic adaptor subunit [Ferruginibacter albus]